MLRELNIDPDRALFGGQLEGLVAMVYENERPLQGLAGLLDWKFHGALTDHLRSGFVTGKEGECVYVPLSWNGTTYHLLLLGGGRLRRAGERMDPPQASIQSLRGNLKSLKLSKIGLSKREFGNRLSTEGLSAWITP